MVALSTVLKGGPKSGIFPSDWLLSFQCVSFSKKLWLLLRPPVMSPYTVTSRLWLDVVASNTALANIGMNCKVLLSLMISGPRQFSKLIKAALEGWTIISRSCIRPMSNIILLRTHDPKEGGGDRFCNPRRTCSGSEGSHAGRMRFLTPAKAPATTASHFRLENRRPCSRDAISMTFTPPLATKPRTLLTRSIRK